MDGNGAPADFIVATHREPLPDAVRTQSRVCLMEDLAANLSGTLERGSDIASGQSPGSGRATILLKGKKVPEPSLA